MIGPSETIPLVDGRLALGTWQQVVLLISTIGLGGGR